MVKKTGGWGEGRGVVEVGRGEGVGVREVRGEGVGRGLANVIVLYPYLCVPIFFNFFYLLGALEVNALSDFGLSFPLLFAGLFVC